MKKKILFGIVIFSLFVSIMPLEAYTFKGSLGEMDMSGYPTHYRTFESNASKRYYMIFAYFNGVDWMTVYSHSLYGYNFNPAKVLLNESDGIRYVDQGVQNRKSAFYLEANGVDLHYVYMNGTDNVWYRKFTINATTGDIYNATREAQLVLDGQGWEGTWEARDEISIVADSEGYPWIVAECFSGASNTVFYFECPFNNGTWNNEEFASYNTLDSEYIDNGGGNPPNDAQGAQLLPGKGKDVVVVWWWVNAPWVIHRSLWYNSSNDDWVNCGGSTIFDDDVEGDWAMYMWSFGYNLEANLSVIIKQHERNPDGMIGLEAQILNYSTYSWGTNFQVGFDEVGDAGSILHKPFASISDTGAMNFVWYKPGNATIWANRMQPNGTLEGFQEIETAEFLLEAYQFSITPSILGYDRPTGVFWMDDIGTLQVGDWAYYDTELLFLDSNYSLPSVHLNTTLIQADGTEVLDGDWLFEGEVYDLVSYVENATSFYVNTTDSRHEILFHWDNSTSEMWINVDPNDQFTIGLAHSEYERIGNITRLLWRFIPDRSIIDSVDNDWEYTIINSDMSFTLTADLGFDTNIYNLGGKTYYTFTGDGGRTVGGQPFEIYATNGSDGSSARAEQIYRKLQHVHFLIEIDMDNEWEGGNGIFDIDPGVGFIDIGIDYRLNGTWELGHYVRLYVQDADVGHHNAGNDHDWIEWSVDWYNYDPGAGSLQNIDSDLIYSNHWGYDNENLNPDYHNRTSSQLWVDLWFDRTNASTTIAGQVNAMYHGMREHGSSWWFGYGAFQPMVSDYGNAQFLDDLYDEGRNVTDSLKFDLMRVFLEVGKVADVDGDDETWLIRAVENFNRKQADDRMQGIEQPAFEETLVLDMPMFQSMNPLIRAIDGVSIAIWKGALGFQKILWGALDSFFAWAGFGEGFFSQITAFLMLLPELFSKMMENMGVAIAQMITMIDNVFTMVITGLPEFVLGLGYITEYLISYWQALQQLLRGDLGGLNILQTVDASSWVRFGFAMLPTFEIFGVIFSNEPGTRLKQRMDFYSGIFNGLMNFIKGFITFMQQAISTIMDILPG